MIGLEEWTIIFYWSIGDPTRVLYFLEKYTNKLPMMLSKLEVYYVQHTIYDIELKKSLVLIHLLRVPIKSQQN